MSQSRINEPIQIIEGHNLDPQKLVNLLQSVYGTPNDGEHKFWVEVSAFYLFHNILSNANNVTLIVKT